VEDQVIVTLQVGLGHVRFSKRKFSLVLSFGDVDFKTIARLSTQVTLEPLTKSLSESQLPRKSAPPVLEFSLPHRQVKLVSSFET